MGLGKIFTKKCAQSYVSSLWRLTWVFDVTCKKFSQKRVPSHMFLRCGDYIKFWIGLTKVSTKMCARLHVFSLWRLTWIFDGTWNNFHKKMCPVTRFFAVETILSLDRTWKSFDKNVWPVTKFFRSADYRKFLMGLGKVFTKKCAQLHVLFAVETILSLDRTWKSFDKNVCPVTRFRMQTILSFG